MVQSMETAAGALRGRLMAGAIMQGAQLVSEGQALHTGLAATGLVPELALEMVEVGGLMSYAVNMADFVGRAAVYVDKIFKGAKPADLPVEQPTSFELVINLATAKTLGLVIPPPVLQRADELIT